MRQLADAMNLALHFCVPGDSTSSYCNMAYECGNDERCRERTLRHVGTTAMLGEQVTSYFGAHMQDLDPDEQAAVLCHEMGHNINLKEAKGGITLSAQDRSTLATIRQEARCPSGVERPSPGGCNHEYLADEVCNRLLLPKVSPDKHMVYQIAPPHHTYRYMDTLIDSTTHAQNTCHIRVDEAWHVDESPPSRCAGKPYVDHFNHPKVS